MAKAGDREKITRLDDLCLIILITGIIYILVNSIWDLNTSPSPSPYDVLFGMIVAIATLVFIFRMLRLPLKKKPQTWKILSLIFLTMILVNGLARGALKSSIVTYISTIVVASIFFLIILLAIWNYSTYRLSS